MLKTLLQLFLSFTKIGFTSFGGLSMIPLIREEMLNHNWMNEAEVMDIVAIAEMTPGPLGLNCATFAGMRTFGILGAIVASLGILMPSLTLTLVAAHFFEKFKNSKMIDHSLVGIRPSVIGMITGVLLTLILTTYINLDDSISYTSIMLSIFDLLLLLKFKISIPILVLINAGLGVLLFGVLGLS